MTNMSKRIAWIPGGASGIGLAAAEELAAAGYRVVLSGRTEGPLAEAVDRIRSAGGDAHYEVIDVMDADAVRAGHDAIVEKVGPVSILVNSAGANIADRAWNVLTPEAFDATIAVNLNGSFYTTLAVLPAMREARFGVIVNIISGAGKMVTVPAGTAYTAAKHAALAMTASLNLEEAANGIRACALSPGEVDTPILLKRKQIPTDEQRSRMLAASDLGRIIRFVAEMPPHVNIAELVVYPSGMPRTA